MLLLRFIAKYVYFTQEIPTLVYVFRHRTPESTWKCLRWKRCETSSQINVYKCTTAYVIPSV